MTTIPAANIASNINPMERGADVLALRAQIISNASIYYRIPPQFLEVITGKRRIPMPMDPTEPNDPNRMDGDTEDDEDAPGPSKKRARVAPSESKISRSRGKAKGKSKRKGSVPALVLEANEIRDVEYTVAGLVIRNRVTPPREGSHCTWKVESEPCNTRVEALEDLLNHYEDRNMHFNLDGEGSLIEETLE